MSTPLESNFNPLCKEGNLSMNAKDQGFNVKNEFD